MKTYFISDLHLGHKNIYNMPFPASNGRGRMREFNNFEECESYLVQQYNNVVEPNDKVYFLGDIFFNKERAELILPQLKGNKFLVMGNHDNKGDVSFYRQFFQKVHGVLYMKKQKCIVSHMPVHPYLLGETEFGRRFEYNIHGHTHDHYVMNGSKRDPQYLNCSVEAVNYIPRTLDELISMNGEQL